MKPSPESEQEEEFEELGAYQKNLRERANRSIQQLSSMLSSQNLDAEEQQSGTESPAQTSWQHAQQSEAVTQLQSLLQKHPREVQVQPLSPSERKPVPKPRSSHEDSRTVPAVQDLVPIIHNQSEYIQHLEAEVKFCKEELVSMKQRFRVVIVENEKLHKELKGKIMEDTLKEYTLLNGTVNEETSADNTTSVPAVKTRQTSNHQMEDKKWQKELEQLKCLYQAQADTLEAQVVVLKKELVSSQKECEELKEHLRHKEAVVAAAGAGKQVTGLCVKCAQHKAVMAETHSNVHVHAIERLTKERDELMTSLCSVRAAQSEAQQREWAAYQQVKQAVEVSEEASLEKAKALMQLDMVQAELLRQKARLEKVLASEQEKIVQAKEAARAESKRDRGELAHMVSSLTQKAAEFEGLLERGERDRTFLNTQLDEAFKKLTSQEKESSKVCEELRCHLSQAQLKREEAEKELRESRSLLKQRLELAEEEVQKLGAELSGSRQRLEEAQRAEGRARAEAAGLAEGLSRAQRQLHLTRQEQESARRCSEEDMAALTFQAQQRERELTHSLQQMEAQHERSVAEMDALLSSQNSLIVKLKDECCSLVSKLEDQTRIRRAEVEELSLEKEHLQEFVESLRGRCQEMEEQCVQHGRMHQRMKHRLQQLDQHCHSSAQQVLELLSRQKQLLEEKQLLSEDMQQLHSTMQVPGERRADLSTLPSGFI